VKKSATLVRITNRIVIKAIRIEAGIL